MPDRRPKPEQFIRTPLPLADLKTWLAHNNVVIMAVLMLIIGVKLIGNAISGFST